MQLLKAFTAENCIGRKSESGLTGHADAETLPDPA
jgi:hypothetical protein